MRRVLESRYYLRGLTAHQAHKHGRVDWTRRYVGSTSRPVCCGECWTRVRVRLHLKLSKRCQAIIAYGGVPELPDGEVQRLDAQDLTQRRDNVAAGRHLHFAARPGPTWRFGWRECDRPFFRVFCCLQGSLLRVFRMK